MMKNKIMLLPLLLLFFSFKADNSKIKYSDIINKYKGSVIYVDMWASWCTPCRKEIKKMKPVKDKYLDKNIVFLYITMDLDRNQCAKAIKKDKIIDVDKNYFIIDIEKDEKYKEIKTNRSIPHYLIYNKKGELVNTDAPLPSDKDKLFKELDKYLTE